MNLDPAVRLLGFALPPDLNAVRAWLDAIPWEAWPQQKPVNGQLRPAMVNDQSWFGFGQAVSGLLSSLGPDSLDVCRLTLRNPVLSVVMPWHEIPEHADAQAQGWAYRLHVVLRTNNDALFITDRPHHMLLGGVYRIDTTVRHAIVNRGDEPRVHLMVDAYR